MIARARLAQLAGRWVWRSPGRAAALLESFRATEASSMLDLVAAANATPSPERRALYLAHALDEDRHARAFRTRARELRGSGIEEESADFDALYERLGELGFLAYVHRGERRGRAQFEAHRDLLAARGDERGAALFAAILVDEHRHEQYTGALLRSLAGGERAVQGLLRKAALREALWGWRRAGRALAGLLFAVTANVLFLAITPFALGYRLTRRRARGWLPPEHG